MKHLFAFVFLAAIFFATTVNAKALEEPEVEEKDIEKTHEFFSMLYPEDAVAAAAAANDESDLLPPDVPDVPGPQPYRRCIVVRCPRKCRVCVCKCVKWR